MSRPATRFLTGWGRNVGSHANVLRVDGAEGVAQQVRRAPPGGLLARGLGRAYGDAALNAGGTLLSFAEPDAAPVVDDERATVSVSAGTSLGRLLQHLVPRGLMLPVVPGTRHVTVGGAIAADIHGKNHHVDSSIGAYVEEISLVDGRGHLLRLTPAGEPELFWATVGGMGLTGVIMAATLRLIRVDSSWIRMTSTRTDDLDDLLTRLATDSGARYQVAWVDCLASGRHRYRAILDEGEHASAGEAPPATPTQLRWPATLPAPPMPVNPLRPEVARAINAAWWHKAPLLRSAVVPMHSFFFPLDRVARWNRLYGPRGFVQYQFAVPPTATSTVQQVLELLLAAGQTPTLTVLKRMGPATCGPLSFAMPGWTAAIDLPDTGQPLTRAVAHADDLVGHVGGRIYLAKDSRSRAAAVAGMYGRLSEWRSARARLDPRGCFASDLSRRTGLC